MKAIEILRLGMEMLKTMSEFGLRTTDYKHVQMYEKYDKMRKEGNKVDYILYYLSQKYHTSESSVKRIIKRLSREFKT